MSDQAEAAEQVRPRKKEVNVGEGAPWSRFLHALLCRISYHALAVRAFILVHIITFLSAVAGILRA